MGAVDQDRNSTTAIAVECSFNFLPDEIARVVEPSVALVVGGVDPAWADYDQCHIGLVDRLINFADKIGAAVNAVEVAENIFSTQGGF